MPTQSQALIMQATLLVEQQQRKRTVREATVANNATTTVSHSRRRKINTFVPCMTCSTETMSRNRQRHDNVFAVTPCVALHDSSNAERPRTSGIVGLMKTLFIARIACSRCCGGTADGSTPPSADIEAIRPVVLSFCKW